RQPLRIIVRVSKRDGRGGANHHENQCNEWRENEDPDRHAFLRRAGTGPRVAATCFPDPLAAADRALLDASRDFRPEPPEPSGPRQRDKEGRWRHEPRDRRREEQRWRDGPIRNTRGELIRALVPPQYGFERHEQDGGCEISPPCFRHPEVGIL